VVIVNTAPADGPDGTGRPQPAQAGPAEPSEGQLLGRAAHVARVFARYGLGDALNRSGDDTERARRVRGALEELGPTFAKLGQILSTRPDLLPPAVVDDRDPARWPAHRYRPCRHPRSHPRSVSSRPSAGAPRG
jgi:ubiquinone biosynthesis protein